MPEHRPDEELIYSNGIDGATGAYSLPPISRRDLAEAITGQRPPENLDELEDRYNRQDKRVLGAVEGVDTDRLDSAGWGVIFARDADPAVKAALSPLLALRRDQAGRNYRCFDGDDGYRPGESKSRFLARHGVRPGPADPARGVPYYLLIVGNPETIPYVFQSQLDVQYATGRIHFETPDEYASYARSVVNAEAGGMQRPRRLTFFGVANPDDPVTQQGTAELVEPLHGAFVGREDLEVRPILRGEATKARLAHIMGGDETPALLFTESHGMTLPPNDPRQPERQGALICQDWPGPREWAPGQAIPPEHYFAGDDLADDANLQGMIAFIYACFGGGTPRKEAFAKKFLHQRPQELAPYPFLGRLPTRMLCHPAGGALAVIGHVERTWPYSFHWPPIEQAGPPPPSPVFQSVLEHLLGGHPVGSAVEYVNEFYSEIAVVLNDELQHIEAGGDYEPGELIDLWSANNDARGYIVIGDPAVQLPLAPAPPAETGDEPAADAAAP
jgi:hypothetical protein